MTITSNGSVGAPSGTNIYNPSDERLKQNVVNLSNNLMKINQMQGVSFNWVDNFCDEETETQYGLIAQKLKLIDSNLVSSFGDDIRLVDNDDDDVENVIIENPLRVNEKFIIPMLVEAVKELSAKVITLENA